MRTMSARAVVPAETASPPERQPEHRDELPALWSPFFLPVVIREVMAGFVEGLRHQPLDEDCHAQEKALREHLSEPQIDKIIKDSFPASDPPSTY
jgi:hypothetical protein